MPIYDPDRMPTFAFVLDRIELLGESGAVLAAGAAATGFDFTPAAATAIDVVRLYGKWSGSDERTTVDLPPDEVFPMSGDTIEHGESLSLPPGMTIRGTTT